MNERPTRPVRPGGQLSASELNRLFARNDSLSDFSGDGIGSSDEMGNVTLTSLAPKRTTIRILSGTNPYAWEEVYLKTDLTWEVTGVRNGTVDATPAVERSGAMDVGPGTVREAVFDPGADGIGRWLFTLGGGGIPSGEFDFVPAIIGCRCNVAGLWVYAWQEATYLAAISSATVKSDGRTGRPAFCGTVEINVLGDISHAEQEVVAFCGGVPTSGTWSLGCATGLASDVSASDIQTALRACLSILVTVSGDMSSGFVITWPSNGAQTTLTIDVSGLQPSVASWPALELNNHKVDPGTVVWMKLVYKEADSAISVEKTATGNGVSVHTAWSIYISDTTDGTFILSFDGLPTATIPFYATGAMVRAAIEAAVPGLGLTSFSGSGTSGSPWTFSVATNTSDHEITADTSNLKNVRGYRFQYDYPSACALAKNIVTLAVWHPAPDCYLEVDNETLGDILNC